MEIEPRVCVDERPSNRLEHSTEHSPWGLFYGISLYYHHWLMHTHTHTQGHNHYSRWVILLCALNDCRVQKQDKNKIQPGWERFHLFFYHCPLRNRPILLSGLFLFCSCGMCYFYFYLCFRSQFYNTIVYIWLCVCVCSLSNISSIVDIYEKISSLHIHIMQSGWCWCSILFAIPLELFATDSSIITSTHIYNVHFYRHVKNGLLLYMAIIDYISAVRFDVCSITAPSVVEMTTTTTARKMGCYSNSTVLNLLAYLCYTERIIMK